MENQILEKNAFIRIYTIVESNIEATKEVSKPYIFLGSIFNMPRKTAKFCGFLVS